MITQDSVRSSTCNTCRGNILLSCPDPINSVAKTVSTELESESEVEPNSKSQINVTNFLNPCVHAANVCNATEVDSSVNLSNQNKRANTVLEMPSATDVAAEVVKLMKEVKVFDTLEDEEKTKELLDKQQIANNLDERQKIRNITELVA